MSLASRPQQNYAGRSEYWPSKNIMDTSLWHSPFLTKDEQHAIGQAITWSKQFEPHRDLVSEAEKADNVLIVLSGWAYRYSCVSDGGRQLTALLVPGDIANLDTLLFHEIAYSVRTITNVTIAALPRSRALALANEHPGLAKRLTASIGGLLIPPAAGSKAFELRVSEKLRVADRA